MQFDPKTLVGNSMFDVKEWELGSRVSLISNKRYRSVMDVIILPVLVSLVGLLVTVQLTVRLQSPLISIISLLLTIGVAIIPLFKFEKEREIIIDWSSKELRFCKKSLFGNKIENYPLQQVEKVVLTGCSQYFGSNGVTPSHTLYWCELYIRLDGKEHKLLELLRSKNDPNHPYRLLMPMAIEMAQALSVEWKWEDYDRESKLN